MSRKTPKNQQRRVVSLIIPCYNEEKALEFLFKELLKLEKKINKSFGTVEYVFVNDGSKDKTHELLDTFIKEHKGIVVHFSRNFGHQAALEAGYYYASGDVLVTLDADLQDPPEVILRMLAKFLEGYDVVLAKRRKRSVDTFFKKYSALAFYKFINFMTDMDIPENVADFRLISKRVRNELIKFKEPNKYWRGLVIYVGFKRAIVTYKRKKRVAGSTHYPLKKMLKFAYDAIIGLSNKIPLLIFIMVSIAGVLNVLTFLFDYPSDSFYLIKYAALLLFAGALFLLADLMVRIYRLLQGRPNYIVAKIVKGKQVKSVTSI